ncbi:multidrug transporter, partial [Acinetobacter baumannii]
RALMTPLLLAMLLGGCTLMPDYQRPAAPVASQFAGDHSAAAASSTPAMAVSDIGWRDVFTDPTLQEVISLSLANNRDLRVA